MAILMATNSHKQPQNERQTMKTSSNDAIVATTMSSDFQFLLKYLFLTGINRY